MQRRLFAYPMARRLGLALIACALLGGAARAQDSPDKIAALVNGDYITVNEFYDRLQRLRAQDFIVSVTPLTVVNEPAGQLTLQKLINERLILQWAAKTKQMPTDAEVNTELEQLKQQPTVAQALAQKSVTEDFLRYSIKVERARFNIATTTASVSPPDVEDYYKRHIAEFSTPERWGLASIRTTNKETETRIEAALKAGKPFSEVAKTYSDDARTKDNGGMMGSFAATDTNLPAPLKAAIQKLKVGEISPPLEFNVRDPQGKTGTIWYFVRLISKEPGKTTPFNAVKDQVERMALLEKAGGYQAADKKIQQFYKDSQIKINLPGYQSLASPTQPKPSPSRSRPGARPLRPVAACRPG